MSDWDTITDADLVERAVRNCCKPMSAIEHLEDQLAKATRLQRENVRLRDALKLALLRMRGVAMEHKTNGREELAEVAQRWAKDIESSL